VLELSEEVSSDQQYSNLQHEQTIIIGEMDEGNIFEDLNLDCKENEGEIIKMTKSDLEELINNLKIRHRAEMDAILIEQTTYKRIIQQLIARLRSYETAKQSSDQRITKLVHFELQCKQMEKQSQEMRAQISFQNQQIEKLKIALVEYDRHMREVVLNENEYLICQLESENAHLRKLLNIPDELFKEDPEELKKQEADKKKAMLKSIDEKLK